MFKKVECWVCGLCGYASTKPQLNKCPACNNGEPSQYDEVLKEQQELQSKFDKILKDNFWDLLA